MEEKLKSCPSCGNKGELHYSDKLQNYIVECTNDFCMASYMIGMKYETKEEAISAWNKRFW